MPESFSPFELAAFGGALIGASAGTLYLLSGRIAGVSNVFAGIVLLRPGLWRWAFVVGLIAAGAAAHALSRPTPQTIYDFTPLYLAASGLLVGFGAKLSNGCTSGHGVCGLARLSQRSLVAVIVFMSAAAITVFATRYLGVLS